MSAQYSVMDIAGQWARLAPVFDARAALTPAQSELKTGADFIEVKCGLDFHLDPSDRRNRHAFKRSPRPLLEMFKSMAESTPDADLRLSASGKALTPDMKKFARLAKQRGLDPAWAQGTAVRLLADGLDGYLRGHLSAGVSDRLRAVIIPHSLPG